MIKMREIFTSRRLGTTLLFGFASGLPLPLTTGTLQAWMASEKIDLKTIGIFSLVGLPYTLKFLWAPILDRFSPPFLKRRTGWIFVFQILLILILSGMGFMDPKSHLGALAAFAIIVAFLSASQDIVIDAYRSDLLPKEELGLGAAAAVAGARIALIVAGALALILSDHMSWSAVYIIMATLLGLFGILTTLFIAPDTANVPPPKSLKEAVWEPLRQYFKKSGAIEILFFIVCYKLGDAIAGAMTTPFLLDIGFTKTDIGAVNKGFGMAVTIFGAFCGGAIISNMNILKALWIFGFLQAFSNLSFVLLAELGRDYAVMIACIGIENISGGMGTAAFTAFLMSLCDRKFSATQYALLTSVMALTRTLAGVPTGFMAKTFGWSSFFFMSTFFAIPGLILLFRMKKTLDD